MKGIKHKFACRSVQVENEICHLLLIHVLVGLFFLSCQGHSDHILMLFLGAGTWISPETFTRQLSSLTYVHLVLVPI